MDRGLVAWRRMSGVVGIRTAPGEKDFDDFRRVTSCLITAYVMDVNASIQPLFITILTNLRTPSSYTGTVLAATNHRHES